jgi:hypothetical protein
MRGERRSLTRAEWRAITSGEAGPVVRRIPPERLSQRNDNPKHADGSPGPLEVCSPACSRSCAV